MTEYSTAFKANMVKKLLMPGGPTASALSEADPGFRTRG